MFGWQLRHSISGEQRVWQPSLSRACGAQDEIKPWFRFDVVSLHVSGTQHLRKSRCKSKVSWYSKTLNWIFNLLHCFQAGEDGTPEWQVVCNCPNRMTWAELTGKLQDSQLFSGHAIVLEISWHAGKILRWTSELLLISQRETHQETHPERKAAGLHRRAQSLQFSLLHR